MTTTTTTIPIDQLRAELTGEVIGPGDAGYDAARAVFVGGIDRHPALIVRVADASDVQRAVELARESGLPLAVRGGGHSNAGHGVCDGGIVIDLRDMRQLDIDVEGRAAWAEAGLTAREVTTAAAEHGLAVGFGDTGSVGIGGITLGGGIGYLVRRFGLTIDDLLAAEIVTADGRLLTVDAEHYPDLFWALRGGGGNFGVVTRFRYRLHELPSFTGGMLMLPANAQVIAGFVAMAEAAPEALSTIANVMPAPPMPFVPEEWHGKLVVMGMLAFAGEADEAQRAVAPFRALATPIADMVRPMAYPEMYPAEGDDYHPIAAVQTLFTDRFGVLEAEAVMQHLEASDAMMRVAQVRVLGGAMARVPDDATAFAHRSRPILVNVAALYTEPSERPAHAAWVETFATALRNGAPGAYVNFLADEGPDRVHESYPGETWDRLASVKRAYDPENLFRLNQNVPPADS